VVAAGVTVIADDLAGGVDTLSEGAHGRKRVLKLREHGTAGEEA